MKKKVFLLFISSLITTSTIHAQGFLHRQGKQIVDGNNKEVILKGVNFGNWMVQEPYMMGTGDFGGTQNVLKTKLKALIGEDKTNQFYKAWVTNYVSKADIDSLKKWGFNSVRLALHYEYFTPLDQADVYTDFGFDVVDKIVGWCKEAGIYAILDMHAAPGGQGNDINISDRDPSKPSLWESPAHQDKFVALWKKLAQRYANETAVGGYDLLNETNWQMDNNQPLRDIHERTIAAVRSVDKNHIVFIEGNWWGNDYTNLLPPFDNNSVYSFHKYWTPNEPAVIDWVLKLRDTYNYPIWCGETGENSNHHYVKEMELFNKYGIGVAWWPMKKIEKSNCFVSTASTKGYNDLVNYWKGNGPQPDPTKTFNALMQLAENLKIQNTTINYAVIKSIADIPGTNGTLPFSSNKIPGVIHTSDYDFGAANIAYKETGTLENSTGPSGTWDWSKGGAYRNDAVDLQTNTDKDIRGNGFGIGFIDTSEWALYSVNVKYAGNYKAKFRVASGTNIQGKIQLFEGNNLLCTANTANTGGWDTWSTVEVPVKLKAGFQKLKLYCKEAGYNIAWIEFEYTDAKPQGYLIPAIIEAEEFHDVSGIEVENYQADKQNIGYIDDKDFVSYKLKVTNPGTYTINYYVASEYNSGKFYGQIDGVPLNNMVIPQTAGWYSWTKITQDAYFPSGEYNFDIIAITGGFNVDKIEFIENIPTSIAGYSDQKITVSPNPFTNKIQMKGLSTLHNTISAHDISGKMVYSSKINSAEISIGEAWPAGIYFISIERKGNTEMFKVIKN